MKPIKQFCCTLHSTDLGYLEVYNSRHQTPTHVEILINGNLKYFPNYCFEELSNFVYSGPDSDMIGLTRNKTYKGFLSQELPIITIINDYGKTYELKPNFFNAVPTNNVSLLEDQIASTQSILSELQEKLKIAKLSLYVLENTAIGAGASKVADQLKTALGLDGIGSFSIREGGNLNGKGLYLSEAYNWSIETDNVGCSVLVIKSK